MNRGIGISILLALGFVIVACNAAGAPSASGQPTTTQGGSLPESVPPAEAGASPSHTGAPSSAPPSASVASADLGEFICDLPIAEPATAYGITNYMDVRVGTHDGYDRLVLEFNAGTPEFTLDHDEAPFEKEPGGIPTDVEGQTVLRLLMPNGTAMMETGESSYDGPLSFDPGFPMLVDVVHGGDFEAQTAWFIGLADEACVRATVLTEPARIVIDVEQ
jgi:hypothetical protein